MAGRCCCALSPTSRPSRRDSPNVTATEARFLAELLAKLSGHASGRGLDAGGLARIPQASLRGRRWQAASRRSARRGW